MKNKTVASLLAIFLGDFGVHKFYLGQTGQGILYLVFCWTFIPGIVGFFEGIGYLVQSDDAFNARFNGGTADRTPNALNTLAQLDALRQSGAITEEEYQEKKTQYLKDI
ncbi:MAG: hypothetical protein C7B44_04720 [Sulfobacillus thermosulfidooxidans]|nr:MAG: hypothetical protein C7B44_04720 [Sulfobacillus thermosulfidooxidans]